MIRNLRGSRTFKTAQIVYIVHTAHIARDIAALKTHDSTVIE